jgi:hypothetical protein
MLGKIERLIEKYESYQEEINEFCGDDFNPMDASGGNFDDAYQLGFEHGETSGKLAVLYELLKEAR